MTIAQINTSRIKALQLAGASSWLVGVLLISGSFIYSQTTPKDKNPARDFGKSLDKYKKKSVEPGDKRKPGESPDDDVIRVETNMVVTDVLVVDQKGNALLGFKKDDFVITENGVPQDAELFSFGGTKDIPRSIVLIIDYSGSMSPYISNSVEAAKILVDKMLPKDRMAIVTDDVDLIVDFSSDKALLKDKLDSVKGKALGKKFGLSLQYSVLLATINELFGDDDIRPIIIFQTDGDEYYSLIPSNPISQFGTGSRFPPSKKFTFDDLKLGVEKSRATIYSVIPGVRFYGMPDGEMPARLRKWFLDRMEQSDRKLDEKRFAEFMKRVPPNLAYMPVADQGSMVEISKLSGGWTDFLEDPKDAEAIYANILKIIEDRYVIGYYPKNEARDGKRRNVKIEIREHPEYTVYGRKTYFAPER